MRTLAKNDDPDKMLHDAAFHQGLHCSLRQNIQRKKFNNLEIITYYPSINRLDYPDFIVCSFMESSIYLERVEIQNLLGTSHITHTTRSCSKPVLLSGSHS